MSNGSNHSQDYISEEDSKVLNETFDIIKNINKEIEAVESAKRSLENDLKKLNSKISEEKKETPIQTRPQPPAVQQKEIVSNPQAGKEILLALKQDIISEFTPILQRFDVKSIKLDILKEINKAVEIENQKLRSEIESKNHKDMKHFYDRFKELENRLGESLKHNEEIKKKAKKLGGKESEELFIELEKSLHDTVEKSNKKFFSLFNSSLKEIDDLRGIVSEYAKELDRSVNEIFKLEKQNKEFKDSFDKFVKVNENRSAEEIRLLEEKFSKTLNEAEKKLEELRELNAAQEEFIVKKINEIVDNVNLFEEKNKIDSKKILETLRKDADDKFKVARENFEATFVKHLQKFDRESRSKDKEHDQMFQRLEKDINELKRINTAQESFIVEKINEVIDDVNLFEEKNKEDVKKVLDNLKEEVDTRIEKELGSKLKTFEAQIEELRNISNTQEDFVVEKINEIIDSINSFEQKNNEDVKDIFEKLQNEIDKRIDTSKAEIDKKYADLQKESDEKVAKQVLANSEFQTRLSTQNKEFRRDLSEDIENRLVSAQRQYEETFNEHLSNFDQALKEKEAGYLDKLLVVEEDKKNAIKELDEVKERFSAEFEDYLSKFDTSLKEKDEIYREKLTAVEEEKKKVIKELDEAREKLDSEFLEYTEKLSSELKGVRGAKEEFEKLKADFLKNSEEILEEKKSTLENYTNELENRLLDVLNKEKQIFDNNENSFREIFSQKVSNLQSSVEKRLENLEKRFLEKNHKIFLDTIKGESEALKIMSGNLESKSQELDDKIFLMEGKVDQFFTALDNEGIKLNEKVENRITNLEKHLNKRFLDFDSDFSNFKSIVIDEVEDLMREINQVLQSKTENIDRQMSKLGLEKSEADSKSTTAGNLQKVIDQELKDMRDEVSELRQKMTSLSVPQNNSMNSVVQNMISYENTLISLVKSLKDRGVSDKMIKEALINKGHPRMYVSMVIDQFDRILN